MTTSGETTANNDRTHLEQGGITLHSDEISVPLTAAAYTHASLPGRTIVRLIPEALLEAEDLALGVTGLEPGNRVNVGHIRRRAIGFPAWPILNDPPNAQHALNLVADLERAAQLARRKPGRAKDLIASLTEKLDASAPHFLPTFLEEAARIFLRVDNTKLASQMYTKAREVERRHGLLVDEERHWEAVLEFAFTGAISTKELSAEAKNLSVRLPAAEAYETFRSLCVERVRGGLTPYAAMKRDLAKLAKAAGGKPADEEAKVAAALLRAGSIERADEKFWKNYKTAIRKAATQDESLRAHLLTLAPEELVIDDWLQLLLDTGAVELVKDGTRPEFVQHIVDFGSRTSWRHGTAEKLAPLLADVLPDAGCASVALRTIHGVPAAALEQLLAHGVALELPEDTSRESVAIQDWAGSETRMPLPHLVADDDFRDFVYQGIVNVLGNADLTAVVATDPLLHPLVIELITGQVERLEAAPPSTDRLLEVTQFARHFEFVDDADVQALLARVRTYHGDLAEVLAETLRRGILDELGWHQCESAYADLQSIGPDAHVAVRECWPGIILHNHKQGIHLVGDTRTEIQNWQGDRLASVLEADGHYGIVHYDPRGYGRHVSWSGSKESLPDEFHSCSIGGMTASVPVPGGRLIGKGVVIRPGQPTWGPGSEHFFVEDDRIWLVTGDTADEATAAELNPSTGRKGRTSLPDWFEEHSRRHSDLVFDPTRSQLRPVCAETADSPLSTADGYHRHAVFTRPDDPDFCLIVDADGTEYTVTGGFASRVCGVVRVPHGEPRLLARDRFRTFLLDPSDGMPTLHHGSQFETVMWWHHTSPRDPEASARFRHITADELRPLIEHFADSGIDDVGDDVDDELGAKVTELLGVQDTAVRDAVVKHAHALVTSWPEWGTSAPSDALPDAPTMQKHRDVLAPIVARTWPKFDGLDVWRGAASLGLHERDVPRGTSHSRGNEAKDWGALLGHGDALLALASIPGRTAEEVQGLKEYWIVLREAGVLEASHLSVDVLEVPQALGTYWIDFPPGIVTAEEMSGWIRYVVRGDGGGPITIDGHTLELVDRLQVHPSRTDLEPVFDALIERIETGGPRPWSPEPGKAFAAATGAPLTDAHLVIAGFPRFDDYRENFLPAELRTAMGVKVADASAARERLQPFREHYARVLAAGVPANAEALLHDGLNIDAMAAYWSEHGPAPVPQLPEELAARKPKTLEEQPLMRVLAGEHADDGWGGEVAALLWLANELDMSDRQRASLADYAEELDQSPAGLDDVSLGASYWTYVVGEKLGLSSSQWADLSEQFENARFRSHRRYADEPVFADLSDITDPDDLDLRVARLWSAASEGDTQTTAAVGLRLSGALSAYDQWLREPGEGSPRDPLAAVPELVAEVAATLNVSEDAARYYLQLLAWADPTDANVRRWNGWKKPDITRAGEELVQAGVVVAGKRPRAGRGFFLQGGWSDSESPHPPVETWKVDAFFMTTPAARSKLRPMLEITVAPEPPTTWFATCWQRSQGDDAPRFAELETTRRSRP